MRWRLLPEPPSGFLAGSPYPPLIRRILYHRGVRTSEEAQRFLSPEPDRGIAPSLPGVAAALRRLATALRQGETIAVYGDFDVDGVTTTALLVQGLRELGGQVVPYIPDRFQEGYGLNVDALASLRAQGVSLVVTADCGTSSVAEVAHAGRLGMDVVVVDHHSVPLELPAAAAIVNPKLAAADDPRLHLSSVGVALHVLEALSRHLGRTWPQERYLDLVALGTVADMAPLVGANRPLVVAGLAALADSQRPGLKALMATAGLPANRLNPEAISFILGPRLNAPGRLAHARLSLDLLLTTDEDEAQELALHLQRINRERQDLTARALMTARELLAQESSPSPLMFIGHPDFSAGIIGLVAGKLVEELYRPVVVCQLGSQVSRGSARTVPELDIIMTLRRFRHLLLRFGGHHQAAGFTVDNHNLPALKEGLQTAAAAALGGRDLIPPLDIDGEVPLGRLDGGTIRWLQRLEPFGQGNPQPVFLSRRVQVVEARTVGSDGQHLRLKLRDNPVTWWAVAFDWSGGLPHSGGVVDIVYSLVPDRRSDDGLEMWLHDLRPSGSSPP